jgi:hypothetical protein
VVHVVSYSKVGSNASLESVTSKIFDLVIKSLTSKNLNFYHINVKNANTLCCQNIVVFT